MERYTIKQLKENKDNELVVYIANKEEYIKLDKLFRLCAYRGTYCYSVTQATYSSGSNKTDSSAYPGARIVEFNQIDFEENLLNNIQIW